MYEFKIKLIKEQFNDWNLFYRVKSKKKDDYTSYYINYFIIYIATILLLFLQFLTLPLFLLLLILGICIILLIKNIYFDIYEKSKLKKLYNEGYHISIFTIPDNISVAILKECFFLTYKEAIENAIKNLEELNSYI